MLVSAFVVAAAPQTAAQNQLDIQAYFRTASEGGRAGIARKNRIVDVRPAKPGEVVVTVIAGQGKETQSPPARSGDMVVRNRCPQTGNEKILVPAGKFAHRYDGPVGSASKDAWRPYRPRGVEMRYVIVKPTDGAFTFTAPWGEQMVAKPGDAIVQDRKNVLDTYRIAESSFRCTYEILKKAK